MCNCKGWDVSYGPNDEITLEPHFCRTYGDCGSVDNTLEEAADEVAFEYTRLYDWYADAMNRELVEQNSDKLDWYHAQSVSWKNRTHPDYLFYANQDQLD